MSKTVKEPVLCPLCGSNTYLWGHPAGERHLQRYRCKNLQCLRQFTPGKILRLKKYPTMPCPKCGGRMSIFKFLSDGYRLRCNNHIHNDKRHCNHKLNVPLPGKSFKIAKDPIECIETELSIKFSWLFSSIIKKISCNSFFCFLINYKINFRHMLFPLLF